MERRAQDPPEKLGEFHHAPADPEFPIEAPPKPRFRHDVPIRTAAVPIDGSILVALDANGDLLGWDPRTARLRYRVRVLGRDEVLQRLTCSPDSRFLAISPERLPSGLVRIHDLATGKEVRRLESCFDPAFSPDGEVLAGSDGRLLRRWAVRSGAELPSLAPGAVPLKWTAYSPKGDLLAASAEDTDDVAVWNVATRRIEQQLKALGEQPAASLVFTPDGKTLAVGSHWGIRFFDTTDQPQARLHGHEEYGIGRLRFSPDGRRMIALARRRRMLVWDVRTGKWLFTWAAYEAPDGSMEVSEGGDAAIWIERGGIRLERIPKLLAGPDDSHVVRRICPTGEGQVVTGDDRGLIRIWDPTTQKEVKRFEVPLQPLRFCSRDGKWAIFGGGEEPVRVWDLREGRERAKIEAKPSAHAVALSPDTRTLALGHSDGSVSLWDVAELREKTRIRRDLAEISAVAWSADGKSLAWGDVAGSVVWAEGSAGLDPLHYRPRRLRAIRDLSFSPDCRTLLGVDDEGLRWVYTGELGREPQVDEGNRLGSRPDHRWNASGYHQKRWMLGIMEEQFSPDGSFVVSRTGGGCVLFWLAPGAE